MSMCAREISPNTIRKTLIDSLLHEVYGIRRGAALVSTLEATGSRRDAISTLNINFFEGSEPEKM